MGTMPVLQWLGHHAHKATGGTPVLQSGLGILPIKPVGKTPVLLMCYTNRGANTSATMLINLMRMFMLGPVVSLKGSPTVSPTTADL